MADCPKCGNEIGSSSYCGCGWRSNEHRGKSKDDGQCHYTAFNRRCRYPSTIGNWCRFHYELHDPRIGEAFIEESETWHNRLRQGLDVEATQALATGETVDNYTPIRQRLSEQRENAQQAYQDAGLTRRQGETKDSHRKRVMAHLKAGFQKIGKAA